MVNPTAPLFSGWNCTATIFSQAHRATEFDAVPSGCRYNRFLVRVGVVAVYEVEVAAALHAREHGMVGPQVDLVPTHVRDLGACRQTPHPSGEDAEARLDPFVRTFKEQLQTETYPQEVSAAGYKLFDGPDQALGLKMAHRRIVRALARKDQGVGLSNLASVAGDEGVCAKPLKCLLYAT